MARIIDYRIEGLAGRKGAVEAALKPGTNVLWGYNGAGKTTLLTLLHAALSANSAGLNRLTFRSARIRIALSDHSDAIVTRTYRKSKSEERAQFEEFDDVESSEEGEWRTTVAPSGPVPRVFAHAYLPISRVAEYANAAPRYSRSMRGEPVSQATLNELFADQVTDRWRQYYIESTRSTQRIQERAIGAILSVLFGGTIEGDWRHQTTDSVDDRTAYALVEQFFRQRSIESTLDRRAFLAHYKDRDDLHQVVGLIRQATQEVDRTLQPQADFRQTVSDLFIGNKRLEFDHRGIRVMVGETGIPLSSLSSGERQLVQLLLEVMAAKRSPVLIDEPELSLHVDWQAKILRAARNLNPDCQIIAATHSPEIIAEAPDDETFEL